MASGRASVALAGADGGGGHVVPRLHIQVENGPGYRTDHLAMMSFDPASRVHRSANPSSFINS